jgi:hypothetical protein
MLNVSKFVVLAGLLVFVPSAVDASCAYTPTVTVKLDITSCKAVDTSKIDANYQASYTGVLVTGNTGKKTTITAFVHHSSGFDCKTLAPKTKITAAVDHACCDGDSNAPCLVDTSAILSKIKVVKK